MELADVKNNFELISESEKACFTKFWQSSKLPSTSKAEIFSPSAVNCFS
jgi:hypothetical protein